MQIEGFTRSSRVRAGVDRRYRSENAIGDDNVNSWSADIDGCMRHQNLVRRRDTTAGEEFIGVRIPNTEALAQFQNGN